MMSVLSVVGRNLKIISRSKTSTFLVLLAPLLIVFLVGTAFNSTSLANINLGVYAESYSELTDSVIVNLDKQNFIVQKIDSMEECLDSVKRGSSHVCIVFPPELSVESNDSVRIYVDNSRVNLAYILIDEIGSTISDKGSEIGITMAQDLLDKLNEAKKVLPEQKESVSGANTKLEEIVSNSEGVSGNVASLQEALTKLDEAIVLAGNSSSTKLKNDLTSIKNQLSEVSIQLSENSAGIGTASKESKEQLENAVKEMQRISDELSSISIQRAEQIVAPIRTDVEFISNSSTGWKNIFPTLLALIILLSSVVLASTMVLTDRKGRANFRNFMTPTKGFSFILGTYLTCLLIVAVQLVILLAGTVYITGFALQNVLGPMILSLFLASTSFIFLGIFIGYLFKSDETTILASMSVAALLIFFSNTILPTEIISGKFRYGALYNPFYVSEVLLRKVVLFGASLSTLYTEILILAGSIVLFFVLSLVFRRLTRRLI